MKEEPSNDAPSMLIEAADTIGNRGTVRDQPSGERSMARTVKSFNAMTGHQLSELDGWQFMELLKMARSRGGKPHRNDYIDGAAYATLAGECALNG